LARAAGVPVTGTSANLTGQPPCKDAEAVLVSLGDEIDLLLDGGKTPGGKGSTVLDVTAEPPVILREGMVGRDQLGSFAVGTRDIVQREDWQNEYCNES
jgi:L-threonylcarbamoyladenylate synthase